MWDLKLNSQGPQASSELIIWPCHLYQGLEGCVLPPSRWSNTLITADIYNTLLYVYKGWLVEHGCQGTPMSSRWLRFRCSLSCTLRHSSLGPHTERSTQSALWWCQPQGTIVNAPYVFKVTVFNLCCKELAVCWLFGHVSNYFRSSRSVCEL